MIKIRVPTPDGPHGGERLWADPTGDDTYVLRNTPFSAHQVAEGDIVRCEHRDGILEVVEVCGRSGNGCLRVFFEEGADGKVAQGVLGYLSSLRCSFEFSRKLVAVTVPPDLPVSYEHLFDYLNSTPEGVTWEIGYVPDDPHGILRQ